MKSWPLLECRCAACGAAASIIQVNGSSLLVEPIGHVTGKTLIFERHACPKRKLTGSNAREASERGGRR